MTVAGRIFFVCSAVMGGFAFMSLMSGSYFIAAMQAALAYFEWRLAMHHRVVVA
ncbi:hypothetical protein D3C75_996660 [compost metagenome]